MERWSNTAGQQTPRTPLPPLPHYTPRPPTTGPGGGDGAGSGWRETMGSGRTTLCLCVAPEVANADYVTRLGSARCAVQGEITDKAAPALWRPALVLTHFSNKEQRQRDGRKLKVSSPRQTALVAHGLNEWIDRSATIRGKQNTAAWPRLVMRTTSAPACLSSRAHFSIVRPTTV